jgi:integrase
VAALEKRGGCYFISWREYDGSVGPDGRRAFKVRRVQAFKDKKLSQAKRSEIERSMERGGAGWVDPFRAHKARPLGEHVAAYVSDLRTLGRDPGYVYTVERRLTKLAKECGWGRLGNVTATSFLKWREAPVVMRQVERRDDGDPRSIGPVTLNQYFETLRAFCIWCVKFARLAANPVAGVERIDATGRLRRQRRALDPAQLVRFFDAVPEHYQLVYRLLLGTGLRRQEVEDLRWGDVRLNAPLPFLKLRAAATKARRADSLPLRADLVVGLQALRGDADDSDKVFARGVPSIDEHREFLEAAGIPFKDSQGRRLDVHSLRHTFGTLLSMAGASPREAMELMRHSDLKLTLVTYTDTSFFSCQHAVDNLPLPPATPSLPGAAVAQ